MPHIDLGFTTSAFIIILLLLAAAAVSFFVYRYTVPPVSRWKRILLISLRSAALFILLAFLFEPLLRLVFVSQQQPAVAVLIDNSKSMAITDKLGDRKAELRKVLSSSAFNALVGHTETHYTFGSSLKATTSTDSLAQNEDATDISAALRALSDEKDRQNIHAALLVTDGAYNLGQNPLYQAEQLGVPIFAVGIGDSSEQKDVLITRVSANDLVYNETQAPVDVMIKSSGYGGNKIVVTLNEGSKELDQKTITLEAGTREYPVRLTYTPEGEGLKKYFVRISTLPDELTTKNNVRSFYAKVLKSKLRVLIIAGGPSPDLSIIKQTLTEEKNLDVRSFTQKIPGGFFEGTFSALPLDSADCIFLIGFPTQSTNGATLDLVISATTQHKKPVFFLASRTVDYGKLQALGSILPFTSQGTSLIEEYVFFQPAEAQRSNPILAIPQSEGLNAWNRLPPIFKTQQSFRSKPEATVLGVSRTQGIILNEPLILTRNVNKQRSMAVLGYGLWRWRLMAQGVPETERLLPAFLANSVKWLTTQEDSRPVKVTTTKESYTEGEPVEFVGQVYDAASQPVDNAQVRVNIRQGEKEFTATLRPIGNGRYEGSVDGLGSGDFAFKAIAQTEGSQIGEDNGRFAVGELNLEFQDTRMNAQLLRQLASRTGGRFYTTNDLSNLMQDIISQPSFTSREATRTMSYELWNWRYSLAVLVLLLGAEWFIRKRSGML